MQSAVSSPAYVPEIEHENDEDRAALFHVILLDDDEHTYDYVIDMLQKLFFVPLEAALRHAIEVDTEGRTIVLTCDREAAEFGRDQIQAYGADPRMPRCKGSMSAIVVPASEGCG